MHQYTADIANRASTKNDVHLVTTETFPSDRYSRRITLHQPVQFLSTGLSLESLNPSAISAVKRTMRRLSPDVVHFTGPHLWNLYLIKWLRDQEIVVIHTLHDLEPHKGAQYGRFITLWNRQVLRWSSHILVHSKHNRRRLIREGLAEKKITWLPLLHLFCGYQQNDYSSQISGRVTYEPFALFFGRIESYKGLEILLESYQILNKKFLNESDAPPKLILAGKGSLPKKWAGSLPENTEWRNRFIEDREAIDLFSRCGLVVLPYTGASQSAIIAAAYYFKKPVIVTRSGAFDEYVLSGQTGYLIDPGDSMALASALDDAFASTENLQEMGLQGRKWYDQMRKVETYRLREMYNSIYEKTANYTGLSGNSDIN